MPYLRIQFSSSKQCFDFWAALVDCRDATAILNKTIKNNSFIAFEQGTQILTTDRQNDKVLA